MISSQTYFPLSSSQTDVLTRSLNLSARCCVNFGIMFSFSRRLNQSHLWNKSPLKFFLICPAETYTLSLTIFGLDLSYTIDHFLPCITLHTCFEPPYYTVTSVKATSIQSLHFSQSFKKICIRPYHSLFKSKPLTKAFNILYNLCSAYFSYLTPYPSLSCSLFCNHTGRLSDL